MISFARSTSVVLCLVLVACGSTDSGGDESGSGTKDKSTSSGSSGRSSSGSSKGDNGNGSTDEGSSGTSRDTSSTTPKKKDYGAQCKDSADCDSDFCIFRTGGSIGMCTQTCEGDIDCPGLSSRCVSVSDAPQKVCVPK